MVEWKAQLEESEKYTKKEGKIESFVITRVYVSSVYSYTRGVQPYFRGYTGLETCTCVNSTLHIPYAICIPRSCMCRSVGVCIVKLGVYTADGVCMIKKRVYTPGGVHRAAAGLHTPQF